MNNIYILLFILFLFELFEFAWQKGNTLQEFMQTLLNAYNHGLIFFVSLHPSFYFILFCIFTLGFDFGLLYFIAIFKFIDISFKISLLHRLQNSLPLGSYEQIFEINYPIAKSFKILPMLIYISLFYFSLNQNL